MTQESIAFPNNTLRSTSDRRIENNSARQQYRVLTPSEKSLIDQIKGVSAQLQELMERTPGRETAVAITNLQTATMWAVLAVTE